jgi:hypothetical protein
MNIDVRTDRQRGCGWRKPGGLYLVSSGLAAPCGALPIRLDRCPCCGNGIKATRGWTWIDAGLLLAPAVALCGGPPAVNLDRFGAAPSCSRCPLPRLTGKHGLLWIGGQFYKSPADFTREAAEMGVSRRLSQLPKDFKLGETWVFVAHREAIGEPCPECAACKTGDRCERCGMTGTVYRPGIFHAFKPSAVEYVVKGDETEEALARLVKRGITPVRVDRAEAQPELASAAQ